MKSSNKPDAVNPAMASRFQFGYHWRGVTDPGRSASIMCHLAAAVVCLWLVGCVPTRSGRSSEYDSRPATVRLSKDLVPLNLMSPRDGRLYLPARIGIHEVLLMIDTGAPFTLLSRTLVDGVQHPDANPPKALLYGHGGAVKSYFARVPLISCGDLELVDVPVFAVDFTDWNRLEMAHYEAEIGGILGSDLLELLGAQIDYRGKLLVITPNEN
jgi:hypothetical protein